MSDILEGYPAQAALLMFYNRGRVRFLAFDGKVELGFLPMRRGGRIQAIKISKLSKIQINLLLIKATWDDAVRGFSIHDYVEYLALLLQLLFAPLTIVAVVLACVAKRNHNRKKKMTEKERTHCNYRENRNLLKGKNKR